MEEKTCTSTVFRGMLSLLVAVLLAIPALMLVSALPGVQDAYARSSYSSLANSAINRGYEWRTSGSYHGDYSDWDEYLMSWWSRKLGFYVTGRSSMNFNGLYIETRDGIIVVEDYCYLPADAATPHVTYAKYVRRGDEAVELGTVTADDDALLDEAVKTIEGGKTFAIGILAVIGGILAVSIIIIVVVVLFAVRSSKKQDEEIRRRAQQYPQAYYPQQFQPQPRYPQAQYSQPGPQEGPVRKG